MSKAFWIISTYVFLAATIISQWHIALIRDQQDVELAGWEYIGSALCDRIDERDEYIALLEEFLNAVALPPSVFEIEVD